MGETRELRELARYRWGEADARRVLGAWEESGLSGRGFAREHGMKPQRLSYWQQRLASPSEALVRASDVSFVAAEVVAASSAEGAVVVRAGGFTVEVVTPERVDPDWLAALVQALEVCS